MRHDPCFILSRPRWAAAGGGASWQACWQILLAGRPCFGSHRDHFNGVDFDAPVAAVSELYGPYPERGSRLAQLVVDSIRPYLTKLLRQVDSTRAQVIVATSHGDPGPLSAETERLAISCARGCMPAHAVLRDQFVAELRRLLAVPSPFFTISAACASALVAVDVAVNQIRAGQFDLVVIVAEDVLSRIAYTGFRQAGAMAKSLPKPFDVERDGMALGEGVAVFALASAELVDRKRATSATLLPCATVDGTAQNCDAKHLVEPNVGGVAQAIEGALSDAGLTASDICGIYWHGTGTRQNDDIECRVARAVFGDRIPPGTSSKGALGHTMGASGAFNMLAACESLSCGLLPPTAGLQQREFKDMSIVSDAPLPLEYGPILINALGFGGINASLVLSPLPERI